MANQHQLKQNILNNFKHKPFEKLNNSYLRATSEFWCRLNEYDKEHFITSHHLAINIKWPVDSKKIMLEISFLPSKKIYQYVRRNQLVSLSFMIFHHPDLLCWFHFCFTFVGNSTSSSWGACNIAVATKNLNNVELFKRSW